MIKNKTVGSYKSWGFGEQLIESIMQLQIKANQNYIKHLCENLPIDIEYIRIPEPSLSEEQIKKIDLDITEKNALRTLESLGHKMGNDWVKNEIIKSIFESKVTCDQ